MRLTESRTRFERYNVYERRNWPVRIAVLASWFAGFMLALYVGWTYVKVRTPQFDLPLAKAHHVEIKVSR